jgi:hypothetical protein
MRETRKFRTYMEFDRAAEYALAANLLTNATVGEISLLREVLGEQLRVPLGSMRRTSDLAAAWSTTGRSTSRFMIEDGAVPVAIAQLQDGEIPSQRFFLVNGDGIVPALLTSRIFNIWARATLSQSPSWSARFSLGRTFETFPLPEDVEVTNRRGVVRELRVAQRDSNLRHLVNGINAKLRREKSNGIWSDPFRESRSIFDVPLYTEIERALLFSYGLKPGVSNLKILQRLVELNSREG